VTVVLFWIAVAVAVVAELAIVAATVRASRPHPVADVPAIAADATEGLPSPRRWLEVLWAVIPALALVALFALTWRAVRAPATDHAPADAGVATDAGVPTR
jgi:heme/copper-type cytochrome/quinol oxidase subunit 2